MINTPEYFRHDQVFVVVVVVMGRVQGAVSYGERESSAAMEKVYTSSVGELALGCKGDRQ